MLHIAIYDTVNGIQRTHRPYHVTDMAPAGASMDAAVSAAAYEVLFHLFTKADIQNTNLTVVFNELLSAIPSGQAREDGLQWGKGVGQAILQLRANDGATQVVNYTPGNQPGQWRPTPPANAAALLPQWGLVTPFAMADVSQFRPHAPPALNSASYTLDYNQTKAYGSATGSQRTADQSQIAEFWADGGGTETPPGHWNRIAMDVAEARSLGLAERARLFALLNLAMADAAICAWDTKYAYNYWRPITAIREAGTDGNPDTAADPAWTPYLVTPPFPEYTSGHSTFSRAAATVLGNFFGTDAVGFTTSSDALPGVTRSFAGFGAAADESGISRIFGGIHFNSANVAGQTSGHMIGLLVATNYLLPLEAPNFVLVAPSGGAARVRLSGEPGRTYVLEACPDLQAWITVGTATANANGEVEFTDVGAAGQGKRFYRALAR
jgi:hypothetical protein